LAQAAAAFDLNSETAPPLKPQQQPDWAILWGLARLEGANVDERK
jgi:hypothetical protein